MHSAKIYIVILALTSISAHGSQDPNHTKAERALRASHPGLSWRYELSIDLDCDGHLDEVFTAKDDKRYYVAAVTNGKTGEPKVSELRFLLEGASQDAFCGPPEPLQGESLDYDLRKELGANPQGFRRSAHCKGLRLNAGECDSFHFYWNHMAGKLGWWRQ